MKVCIIDYGVGNLASVQNAFTLLGVEAYISSQAGDIREAEALILPGVGSFEAGMNGLKQSGLTDVITEEVLTKKKKILGICLGMQLFATTGFENGEYKGLGFIQGSVIKIDDTRENLRLPHIGWNDVTIVNDLCIGRGFENPPIFYFVHSYHVVPDDPSIIAGYCQYGGQLTVLIQKENIFGAQFHPEKSHSDGLQILRNFISC
ncbi:MAG: imidazole glycerol phosphate synthase subunit HisH [Candidatus Pacebacteria bacterium]|nr:imidazole glycerol phosphate synthase subunit HisH [Candidatus Paceibacterota bacterium]MBP9842563.1 imidazole glycerol phosphate synthase subunit HisH [Candidatus Paceibacterota bacterium]